MTEAEKVICRLYLEDMDKNHTCNEYKLLMELLDKEPCEDVISRQDAIAIASDLQIPIEEYQQYNQAINNYCAEIMGLPSAQPTYTDAEIQKMQDLESAQIEKAYQLGYEEGKKDAQTERKKGKWINLKNKNGTILALRCSVCDNSPKHAIRSDYCPSCGADMRGKQDE